MTLIQTPHLSLNIGTEIAKNINFRSQIINIIIRHFIGNLINILVGDITNNIGDKLTLGAWSLYNRSIAFANRMRSRLCPNTQTPTCKHKIFSGCQSYDNIVNMLINSYHDELNGTTHYTCDARGNVRPVLQPGENLIITYKSYKINIISTTEISTVDEITHKNLPVSLSYDSQSIEISITHRDGNKILKEFESYCLKLTMHHDGLYIYTNFTDGRWLPSKSIPNGRKLETIILKGDLKEHIIRDINFFMDHEQWCISRGIPHNLGILFYGAPGTGKTTMISVIAAMLKKNIYYMIMDNIKTDNDFHLLMNSVPSDDIIVMEDIDRCGLNTTSKITLPTLLNSLDGFLSSDGRVTIFTANNPEKLDSAFMRPGRIDHMYHLDRCDRDQISKLYNLVFGKECPANLMSCVQSDVYTPAEIMTHYMEHFNDPHGVFGQDFITNDKQIRALNK